MRSGTSTTTSAIGTVPDGGTVRITCQTRGQTAYVNTGSDGQIAPSC